MKKLLLIPTLWVAIMTNAMAAEFVNPMTYDETQKDELIAFAREMAIKNYGADKEPVVEFMTNKLVNACIWLSKNGDDTILLHQVIENWRDADGDYLMMKFEYEQKELK